MTNKQTYLSFIQSAYERESSHLEAELEGWRRSFDPNNALFGYSNPKFPLWLAVTASFLYQENGERAYAEQARDALLGMRELTRLMSPEVVAKRPEYDEGIPPLDCVFDPVIVAPACERIRDAISEQEYRALSELVADSLRPVWRFPEWGGHNRTMLRAASLAAAAHAFPAHPQVVEWVTLADELAEESWGRWSIEDAMLYQVHWLRAMFLYAEARQKDDIYSFIQPHFYLRSMAQMLMPIGILPDFGDSHWQMHSQWEWLACLEWGARVYRDPLLKWAVQEMWQAQKDNPPTLYHATVAMLAYRWCDENTPAQPPGGTPDALDDLISKKLVFRNGWERNAAYACVNYRDEGSYARVSRDYLRTTLAVSAEKMHHGHSDEGSFSALCWKDTLLLHESGYRESPPDGIYRADIYHNRLVWRPGVRLPGTTLLDYLRDNGHYKPVVTERLYQTHLSDIQISRIRTTDEVRGVQWDRSIFFLPALPCWVVVDSALSLRSENRTFSALWWTTDILASAPGWFDTHIRGIQDWQNRHEANLLIAIPSVPGQNNLVSLQTARRCFQQETLIASAWGGEHRLGRAVNFVTVLMPHDASTSVPFYAESEGDGTVPGGVRLIPSQPQGRGIAVQMTHKGETITLATLNDLTCGYLQEDIRPRYTVEAGLAVYDQFASDAAFVCARQCGERLWAGFINGTRLCHGDTVLYQGLPHAMFQEDRTAVVGIPARFKWEGEK